MLKPPSFASLRPVQLAAVLLVSLLLPHTACFGASLRVPQDYPDITSASSAAVGGDSILVWPPNGGGGWEFQQAILQQGVILRGMGEPTVLNIVRIMNSDVHLLDGPLGRGVDDTTRVENLFIGSPMLYESVQVFSARSSIKGCMIGSGGPLDYYSVRMWQGGSIVGNTFGWAGESCSVIARQGTIIVAWNTFQSFRGFVLDTRSATQPANLSFRNNTVFYTHETALLLRPDSEAEVVNCIFYNSDDLVCFNGNASVRHNNFWPATDYGQCVSGPGNIGADPLFCSGPPGVLGLWVMPNSPCVGTGEGGVNIGSGGVCGVAGVPAETAIPEARLSLQVSPNPVRSRTEFRISGATIPEAIEIYDTAGRVVDIMPAGEAPFVWEPSSSVRPGVYFVRMRAKEGSVTRKLVLLPR